MELQLRLPGDRPVGRHGRALAEPAGEDLKSVLIWLQEVEINVWISTTPPAHIAASVHDPYGGEDIRRDFHAVDGELPRGEIGRCLIATVRRHHPRARQ